MKPFTKKIVLENGREFYGYGFGADREAINEIVFNTSMVGYQEIMSDPSYTDQMVVMTRSSETTVWPMRITKRRTRPSAV